MEGSVQSFRELRVWQRSHALVLEVYHLSEAFPASERFGVVPPLRRAAVSVPTRGRVEQSGLDV